MSELCGHALLARYIFSRMRRKKSALDHRISEDLSARQGKKWATMLEG
jgi:hypothetical protein